MTKLEDELDAKMQEIMEEHQLCWQAIHIWVMSKGYVILTEEDFKNLPS